MSCEAELIWPSEPNNTKIGKALRGRVKIEKGVFFIDFSKKEGIQQVLHSIKYQNQKKLGIYMAEQMAQKLGTDFFRDIDVLIPVPLHPKKNKIRGYNQAELIAQGVYNFKAIPINTTSLIRVLFTESQTNKNRLNRWRNVQDAFELKDKDDLNKKHVLLLDDVFTTGATLEACIKTLQKEIDCKCSILTLVRA
tara:strand:- start:126 stop:707 length:582 start_codon:yes stop_codon:yes gene_type:complete